MGKGFPKELSLTYTSSDLWVQELGLWLLCTLVTLWIFVALFLLPFCVCCVRRLFSIYKQEFMLL